MYLQRCGKGLTGSVLEGKGAAGAVVALVLWRLGRRLAVRYVL